MHHFIPAPELTPYDARILIADIMPLAYEKFGIRVTISDYIDRSYGGAFNGQDVILNQNFVADDPIYAAYALIHGGLGHSYQLWIRDPLLLDLYCNPKPTRSEDEIEKIKVMEGNATTLGIEMTKALIPESDFIKTLPEFCTYWFAQDWKQLDYFLETGRTPMYGQRQILEAKDVYELPSAQSVSYNPALIAKGPVLDAWVHFNVQAPAAGGTHPKARLARMPTL